MRDVEPPSKVRAQPEKQRSLTGGGLAPAPDPVAAPDGTSGAALAGGISADRKRTSASTWATELFWRNFLAAAGPCPCGTLMSNTPGFTRPAWRPPTDPARAF